MKLQTALKVIVEARYIIAGLSGYDHDGVFIMVDLISHNVERIISALGEQCSLVNENPDVKWITYNTAYKCIQIDIM